jgi:hypothetical protein
MPKYVKLLSGVLVLYFFVLGLFGLACLIHFSRDYEQNGGAMGPMYFFVYYCLATVYYSPFLIWSFRLYRSKRDVTIKYARNQLILIVVLGVCSSLYILWRMFAT